MNYLIDINFEEDIYFNKRRNWIKFKKFNWKKKYLSHIKFTKGFHKVIDTQGYGIQMKEKKNIEIKNKIQELLWSKLILII